MGIETLSRSGHGPGGPGAAALASAATRTSWESLPREVQERVADILVDTLAVFALGSDRAELVQLRKLLKPASGGATLVGMAEGVAAQGAAFFNGATTTVHQFDEWHRESRGHPGIHAVPAALAIAEERGLGGAKCSPP